MRLLFVIPEYPPHSGGGIITFYRHLLPQLAANGHSVRALVGSALSAKFESYESDGVDVTFLDHDVVTANLGQFERFHAIPGLQRHLAAAWTGYEQAKRGDGFDVVETVDWGMLFVPWVVDASAPPTVVQLHGSIGQIDYRDAQQGDEVFGCLARLLETTILSAADELQAYSIVNAREWNAITGREVACMLPGWSPAHDCGMGDDLIDAGLAVGRIQYWKGPIVLCSALRLLGSAAPIVDWVGRDTPYRHARCSMSSHLTGMFPDIWNVKVRPVGPCSPDETAARQARAAFCVVPSTWDVFNFTSIEAMGAEQVVICSTGAGAADLIADGQNGFTFASEDADALAGTIERVLSLSRKSREEIGRAARNTILAMLDPMKVAAQRIDQYDALASKGRGSRAVHPWISAMASPGGPLNRQLAFLDNLPLRELSEYTMRRGLRRVFQ